MDLNSILSGDAITEKETVLQPHYSYSALSLLADCEKAFHSRYIAKDPFVSNEKMDFGTNFELVMAKDMGFITEERQTTTNIDEQMQEINATKKIYQQKPWSWKRADAYQEKIVIDPDFFQRETKRLLGTALTISKEYVGYIDFRAGNSIMDLKTTARKGFNTSWGLQTIPYLIMTGGSLIEIHAIIRTKMPQAIQYIIEPSDEMKAASLLWIAAKAKRADELLQGDLPTCVPNFKCNGCTAKNCPLKVLNDIKESGE